MEEETVSMELRHAEFSQHSIRETLDELHNKASSVLLFTLQWKDLEQHFVRIRDSIESGAREVQTIKDSLNVALESIDLRLQEVEAKEKELERIKEAVEERFRQIEVLETEFGLKRRRDVEERSREIERTEESAREVDKAMMEVEEKLGETGGKEERLQGISKTIEERCGEMKGIESDMKERMGEFEVKEKEFEDRVREFGLIQKRFEERSRVHEQKEQQYEKRLKELESKEKQFEERCQDLELKEKQFEKRCKAFKAKEEPIGESKSINRKFAESPEPGNRDMNSIDGSMDANLHFYVTMDGKALQIFLNERWKEHDVMRSEVFVALQMSSNPAKLVLDAMQGFYPPHLKKEGKEFEGNVVMQSCILLLEQLMEISPPIRPNLREEAMQLAFDWITKMRVDVEHSSQVLGFLLLLTSYGLASAFDSDELLSYMEIVSQHSQAPELLRVLGLTDKIPVASTSASTLVPSQTISPASDPLSKAPLQHQSSSNCPGNVDTDEDPLNLIGGTVSSVPSVQPTCLPPTILSTGQDPSHLKIVQPTPCNSRSDSTLTLSSPTSEPEPNYFPVDVEGKGLRLILSEKENDDLTRDKVSAALQHSVDPAKLVLDVVKGEGFKFDVSKERCILLLEQLRKLSPLIKPHVKEEALKFANSWKENLLKQDQLEVVCVLHFLATYGLASSVNGNELLGPLGAGFWVKMGPNLREVIGLADLTENYIRSLIEKNQRLEAIKVIHAVEMIDKFPLVIMLKDHLNYIKNKAKISCKTRKIAGAINNQISQLRDVTKCILQYKLESQISVKAVEEQILQLEKQIAKEPQDLEESKLKREASTKSESLQKKCKQQQSTASTTAPVVSSTSGPPSITASASTIRRLKLRQKKRKKSKYPCPTPSQHSQLPAGQTPSHPHLWHAGGAPPHNYHHPAGPFGYAGTSDWERSARPHNFPVNVHPRSYYEHVRPHCPQNGTRVPSPDMLLPFGRF
ncbi:putative Protein FRIGIDA [Tripterygium wilfordii]|uniref:FRIGIDA-like protein n=1 Tax=Tripterygium wilfordii TaxID=458696 RepID=A0A7J7D3C6_TRIWF|nr:FRIGIDA-like protein 5 [Tripterygium wilfordii]KAF5740566.1 putative Protein FRIGIDA [Tripterygium wilfordii]